MYQRDNSRLMPALGRRNAPALVLLTLWVLSCRAEEEALLARAQDRYPMLRVIRPENAEEDILYGQLLVQEDRDDPAGKRIPIDVYLIPSSVPDPPDLAFVEYNGGPAVPNANLVSLYTRGGVSESLRELRDVLLVDQRGTGASALPGTAFDGVQLSALLFEPDLVRKCLEELGDSTDLSQYNTANAVEDLEEVRRWLDIDQIDFHGLSYGTRVGLEYMRRYPASVHSLILTGTVPPDFGYATFVDLEVERQLHKLIERCASDPSCRNDFPEFESQLYELKARLTVEPVSVEFVPEGMEDPVQVVVDRTVFVRLIGQLFLSGDRIERLPFLVDQASAGDLVPLLRTNVRRWSRVMPLYFSQFCPEDVFNNPVDREALAHTFTEGQMGLMEVDACMEWTPIPSPGWLGQPLRGDAPVLLLTGGDDAQTPPRMADWVAERLPNARHVVFPDQGHSWTEWRCWDTIAYQFLQTGDLGGLDTACFETVTRPAFVPKEGRGR